MLISTLLPCLSISCSVLTILRSCCARILVRPIFKSGQININERLSSVAGRSALHVAAECGHRSMIELLLASGAASSLQLDDSDGFTPAQLALVRGHQKVARLLLQKTAAMSDASDGEESLWCRGANELRWPRPQ